jgi:hypothetical protein
MSTIRSSLLTVAAISLLSPAVTLGTTLGQVDTFEDGTAQGWVSAAQNLLGGPSGSNDRFLQFSAGISGLPTNLELFNRLQWSGNYLAAGVTGIEMDLKLISSFVAPVPMRIAIREGTAPAIMTGYASTTPFMLPRDDQWHHVVFSLQDMTGINAAQSLASDLANVVEFRLLGSTAPSTIGGSFPPLAQIGVDNIRAVPEPSTICLAASAAIALIWIRRRTRPAAA